MEIPKKIKICGIEHDVIFDKMQDPGNYGMYVCKDSKIYLNKDGTDRQYIEYSFIHEILHAIDKALGNILDEEKVSSISRAFYQVLKDNNMLR